MKKSLITRVLEQHIIERQIPYELEFKFCSWRKFRADFALFPTSRPITLIEIQGGVYLKGGGRHNRGPGYENDLLRSNIANLLGYICLAYSTKHIQEGAHLPDLDALTTPTKPTIFKLSGNHNQKLDIDTWEPS